MILVVSIPDSKIEKIGKGDTLELEVEFSETLKSRVVKVWSNDDGYREYDYRTIKEER